MKNTVTIGMDLGDKNNHVCILGHEGNVIESFQIPNSTTGISKGLSSYPEGVAVIEAGTHSPWISRLLLEMGYKVFVGNPRKLRLIWNSPNKYDGRDAEMLARIGRFDPSLLYPVQHRGEQAHSDLALIKARDLLSKVRSKLINHIRSTVKSVGARIPSCSAPSFHKSAEENIPDILKEALSPLQEQLKDITQKIRDYERKIDEISHERYPETKCLQQIHGVGPITSLAYVLTLEDPARFDKSRDVAPFLGLTPKRDQSGETDKQLRITKAGNCYLRRLLVGCGQYILGPFGEECELRNFGQRISQRGGKIAKRRAVVAVARKLAVLLHRLWITGEEYRPFYRQQAQTQ